MKTELYLIRHGESPGNRDRFFLGHTDLDLTEKGYAQAKCAAAFFENIHIDAVYASDLLRAFNTAKAVADSKGLVVTPEKGLRELFAGRWEEMKFADIPLSYPELWSNWQNANVPDLRAPEGESLSELLLRVERTLLRIAKENEGKSVAVGLHATPIRLMLNKIAGRNLEELYMTSWVLNASITKLSFENGSFSLDFANECSHLGALKTAFPRGV